MINHPKLICFKFSLNGQIINREELLEKINFLHASKVFEDSEYVFFHKLINDPLLLKKLLNMEKNNA